jgi:acyl phosphate:glycerol-3-phosphate acyltransferase
VAWLVCIIAALVGYLLGSIPTGFVLARAKGIDIRTVGSGNIGATNVFRVLGKSAGLFVLLVDGGKGFLACWLGQRIAGAFLELGPSASLSLREWTSILAGISAILGHNYTCWLKLRGGKGVATTAGVLVALLPKAFLIGLGVWLAVFAVSRYVSLASVGAALALPFAAWAVGASRTLTGLAALLGALAIFKHKSNIQRLLHGTEHRFGQRKSMEKIP